MRLLTKLFFLLTVFFAVSSCIDHEVIPPPVNTIDLNATFVGYVNGTQIEFTQNVEGYKGYASKSDTICNSPELSKMLYISEMRSPYNQRAVKLTLGALGWDASANTVPTLTMFNDFNTSNSAVALPFKNWSTFTNPVSAVGVQFEYTDQSGNIWISRQSDLGQTATFTLIKQASDNTGDYSLFEANFSCKVWRYNVQTQLDESLNVSNAKLRAWFKN
jgi:hypothetical protein